MIGVWDGDHVELGAERLEVIGLVGHTPGSITLWYEGGGITHLFTGDSLFPGGPGRTTTPEDFSSLMNDLESKIFGHFDDDTVVHPVTEMTRRWALSDRNCGVAQAGCKPRSQASRRAVPPELPTHRLVGMPRRLGLRCLRSVLSSSVSLRLCAVPRASPLETRRCHRGCPGFHLLGSWAEVGGRLMPPRRLSARCWPWRSGRFSNSVRSARGRCVMTAYC